MVAVTLAEHAGKSAGGTYSGTHKSGTGSDSRGSTRYKKGGKTKPVTNRKKK